MHIMFNLLIVMKTLILTFFVVYTVAQTEEEADQLHKLSVDEIATKFGYNLETHYFTTSDGYVLCIHRIPQGKKKFKKTKPLILNHGLLGSSCCFFVTPLGLAYRLADQGFDVWMPNSRGNSLSRNHTTLDLNSEKFWEFSWHEIGAIDLPELIDHVLNKTNEKQVYYIGHSQGTTTYYVMTTYRPEYNKKIKVHISMSPVAYIVNAKSPLLQVLSQISQTYDPLHRILGVRAVNPYPETLKYIGSNYCTNHNWSQPICKTILLTLMGIDTKLVDRAVLPMVFSHCLSGASVKNLIHYSQLINSDIFKTQIFRQYDHGIIKNNKLYGTPLPPNYDLTAVTTPVYLICSSNDWLSDLADVHKLASELPNLQEVYLVPDKQFNHIDYLFATDLDKLINRKVISILKRYV